MANACDIGALAQAGINEWGDTEEAVYMGDRNVERPVPKTLEYVYKWHDKVTFNGGEVSIDTGPGGITVFPDSKWILGYMAVLAWWDVHPLRIASSTLTGEDRIREIIQEEIPLMSTGLDLTELIELTKEEGWNQKVKNAYGTEEMDVCKCLYACAQYRCIVNDRLVRICLYDVCGYESFDPRWVPVFEALQNRLETQKVGIPGFENWPN